MVKMAILTEAGNKTWDRVKTDPFYKEMLDEVKAAAQEFEKTPVEALKFSEFNLFYQTGNRMVYETAYFERRGRLNAYALLYLVYREQKYLSLLENVIWAICDEFTWALPAHVQAEASVYQQERWIDLFASETGFALSEIYHLIGNDLSPLVRQRLEAEVRRRILDSYIGRVNEYGWESCTNNWAAVCGGSVGNAFLYLGTKEEIETVLPRLRETLRCFLAGFNDDGCCMEGYGYWCYGFGFFLQFASLLRQYTDGKVDLLADKKVEKIAQFQQKVVLSKDNCISFSDGGMKFSHNIGISHFVYHNFEGIELPDKKYRAAFGDDACYRWGTFLRDFIWTDQTLPNNTMTDKSYYLEGAKWYIKRMPAYAFAAKAGNNDEPHNHNDVGSFLFTAKDRFILYDLGSGEYTAQYFRPETRYGFLVNSSRGHNLPIIDGCYQKEGKAYCGEVLKSSNTEFIVEFSKAYGQKNLKTLERGFLCDHAGITVTDKYRFETAPASVVERFVTLQRPSVQEGKVIIADSTLAFDPRQCCCKVSEEEYSQHDGAAATAYLIDLTIKQPSAEFECRFTLE